jgi:fimbrial isopeptide formation D2 family protein/LPXTG-motif cell wall-anchored protein
MRPCDVVWRALLRPIPCNASLILYPKQETNMTPIDSRSRIRRAMAAASVLVLGALGVFGLVGSASADPIGGVGSIVAPDPSTSSIVVHKYTKTATNGTTPGDGTPATPTGVPIDGVTFLLQEVVTTPGNASLDLLTDAGWTTAASIQSGWSAAAPTTLPAGYTLTAATSQVTAGGGTATFGSLHYGLYLVTEQSTTLPDQVVDPALPFLVTLPFPTGPSHPTNPNEWLYQVEVYPKNSVTGLAKVHNPVATDAGFYTAGDYVSWTITADVPLLAPAGVFDVFTITDTIDPANLEFVTGAVPSGISPLAIRVFNSSGTDVTANFALTTDYTFTISGGSSELQTLAFTAAGLTDLGTFAQGGRIEFVVPTQVVAIPANGIITNDANSVVNDAELDVSDPVDLGQLRAFKYAMTDIGGTPDQTPLQGATFQVYHDADTDGVADAGELVTVDGASSFTTDVNGMLNITALKTGDYLLVETAAPVGYQLDATPHPVTVVAGTVVVGGANYIEIENDQLPPWALAFTGGSGVVLFTIAGIGLMALALGFALFSRRRRQATA